VPASKTSLLDVLEDVGTQTIHYIYDFGDNWHHVIKVEKIDDAIVGTAYPRLVRAIGACPRKMWAACRVMLTSAMPWPIQNTRNVLEGYGRQFDPDEADIGRILDNFERLAKKNGPRSRVNKKPHPNPFDQYPNAAALGGC